MINFCLYVFIFYAVASSARAILLSGKTNERKKSRRTVSRNTVTTQKAPHKNNIIKLNQTTARRGKTPLRVAFSDFCTMQNFVYTSKHSVFKQFNSVCIYNILTFT